MASTSFKVESGIQLLARLTKKPTIENFYPHLFLSGPKPGEVIELEYSENTPKCILTDIVSTALLPTRFGGAETSVLIFNCNGNFNYLTLMSCMATKILSIKSVEKDVNDIIEKQFNNLFVVEIYDATQYYTTIYNLENVLLKYPNITLVVFDTLTAFYWSEQSFKIMRMENYLKKVLSKIQNVSREHKIVIIYTKPEYFNQNKDMVEFSKDCNELSGLELINYKLSISLESDKKYLVHIKANNEQPKKKFHLIDGQIRWISD